MVNASAYRICGSGLLAIACSLLVCAGVASARPRGPTKTIRYHGYAVSVPRSWKVFDLRNEPRVCVRFDRHAVYLGRPGSQQLCPAHAVGRTEAILIQPATAGVRRSVARSAIARSAASVPHVEGSATTFLARRGAVLVTATWSRDAAAVAHALHRASLPSTRVVSAGAARAGPAGAAAGAKAPSAAAHAAATTFGGLGFDACSAPSPAAMTAWGSSPYRAVGIYIGGVNAACAQPNLTPTWVAGEVVAGWHVIPIYVGLQAPSNACRCAGISPAQAAAQGTAAAIDAVSDAQSIGIPAGNPIYNDMEAYTVNPTNSNGVLAFLSAWTTQLHAEGYLSGVYSSTGSGVADLVRQLDTSFAEPDDIWFAQWNSQQTTSSSSLPATAWPSHQRLHQYRGAHNESYGAVTINIDNDFLDGETADTSGTFTNASLPPPPPPTLRVSPAVDGTTALSMSWNGGNGVASWRVLAGTGTTSSALAGVASARARGASQRILLRSGAPAFAVQALDTSGQVLATSAAVRTPPHIAVYGHSAFVSSSTGTGGVPVGCFTGRTCRVSTTVFAGRTTIATTGAERVGANGSGIVFFNLSATGRRLLARVRGHRLAVNVKVRDSSGTTALVTLTLIPFSTSGRGPQRGVAQSPPLRIVGVTDFVSGRGVGGVLAGCASSSGCAVTTVVSVGRTVVARTGGELLGADELGYVIFPLTPQGRTLLARARNNQLGARVTITAGTATAAADIALVRFS
jgi:Domain of unknown function (DUF1906)